MVSFLPIDAFEARLRSVCEEEKLFYGTVKDGEFIIRKGGLSFTSYYIKGTYSKLNNMTTVNFSRGHDKLIFSLILISLVFIPVNKVRGRNLERTFIEELDIAPNS